MEAKRLMTAEEFAALPTGRGTRYELVEGKVREMAAAGFLHGMTVSQTNVVLGVFVAPRDLGALVGAETGFRVQHDPDVVYAPDVAFVAGDRLPPPSEQAGFLPLAPDFVVEVVSPSDRRREVRAKVADWLRYGTRVVWVLNPTSRAAEAWRADGPVEIRRSDEEIDAEPVLPGFRCFVRDLFPKNLEGGS